MPPPNRLTIVPSDKIVRINEDGRIVTRANSLHPDIHAIQWYGDRGEIEWKDPNAPAGMIRIIRNEKITSIASFQAVIDDHAAAPKRL